VIGIHMNQTDSILKLRNVTKTFARQTIDEVIALSDITFDVHNQDFITIIGSNGAGKSTILNIVAGLYPPDRGGKIYIGENDVTRLIGYKRAGFVGRVWQQPDIGTAGHLTIEENLSLAILRGKRRGLRRAVSKARKELFCKELSLLNLGLEDRLKTPVNTLSGGQRQALSLVMATISKPSILLLDEHVGALDPNTAKTVLELTDKIVEREQMTTVMVTHNMEVALHLGNRLIMMHKGKIVVDIDAERKRRLKVSDLVSAFEQAAGESFDDDSILLSHAEHMK